MLLYTSVKTRGHRHTDTQTDRHTDGQTEIILYFPMVKILAQRTTDISAVATILLIIKTFARQIIKRAEMNTTLMMREKERRVGGGGREGETEGETEAERLRPRDGETEKEEEDWNKTLSGKHVKRNYICYIVWVI